MADQNSPLVSIGVPTFNRPDSLQKILSSLLSQTYENIEVIVSDNASDNPEVKNIIEKILEMDQRGVIRYYRQPVNRGAAFNFKFVLDKAQGEYFMWNADDDFRSADFIELNTKFLEKNPKYAASTSPNALVEHFDEVVNEYVTFDLIGDLYSRYMNFLEHALISHGIFYSQFRMDAIRGCPFLGKNFIAADWAMNLYVLSQGPIARLKCGYILNSRGGVSESDSHFKNYRQGILDDMVPMYRFYHETRELYSPLTMVERFRVFKRIMQFNKLYYSGVIQNFKSRIRKF